MGFNKIVTVKQGQSIFDLALQLYGSADNWIDLIRENPQIENIESDLTGMQLSYVINNSQVQKSYIADAVEVGTKPINYANSDEPGLIYADRFYIVQSDGYKILL